MPHPYDNIPLMLKQRPNWVAWGIRDAPLKAPFNPVGLLFGRPAPAKAGVPETWSSYINAVECVRSGLAQGISTPEQVRFLRIGLERDRVFRALWMGERRHGNESAADNEHFMQNRRRERSGAR